MKDTDWLLHALLDKAVEFRCEYERLFIRRSTIEAIEYVGGRDYYIYTSSFRFHCVDLTKEQIWDMLG